MVITLNKIFKKKNFIIRKILYFVYKYHQRYFMCDEMENHVGLVILVLADLFNY